MTDYIKRENAIEQARRNWIGEGEWEASTEIQPADVVEVVRCKDCKRYQTLVDSAVNGLCSGRFGKGSLITVSENGYCYMGERKDK